MERLLFHIGMPKTGSSALQVFFAQNRDAMLAHSVDYLPIGAHTMGAEGKITSGNGGPLARKILQKPGTKLAHHLEGARAEFLASLKDNPHHTGLVSSELLCTIRPDKMGALLEEVHAMGIRTEVIYFIREQEQLLCSSYMQRVKRHGCVEAPEDHISAAYVAPGNQLNYNALYDQMLMSFEPSAVHCRVYEDSRKAPNGLFGAFLDAAGIPSEGLDFAVQDVNNSLQPSEIGIMLVLNRYAPRFNFSDAVVENSRDTGRTRSGSRHRLIPSKLSHKIRNHFAASNKLFAQRYFQRDTLFPLPAIVEGDGIDVDQIDPIALAELFGGLLVKYDQRLAILERRFVNQARKMPQAAD